MKRNAQVLVVLIGALFLKLCYSTASADQLRWILAPTTLLVELISGTRFSFESRAGYLSSDGTFLIAVSCAGVNFLITSFLMLSLARLFRERSAYTSWGFIPVAALVAYLTTVIANTARISTALSLRRMPLEIGSLSPNQIHRLEGIFIYFGFLLLLYLVTEQLRSEKPWSIRPRTFFPLVIYYATTLGIPLLNGGYRHGTEFWEYSLFVFVIPLFLMLTVFLCATSFSSVSLWLSARHRATETNYRRAWR
jgi:exosortase K